MTETVTASSNWITISHTDDDWKGKSGNGNGNNKDNTGSGNSGNTSGNGTGNKAVAVTNSDAVSIAAEEEQLSFWERIVSFLTGGDKSGEETASEDNMVQTYGAKKPNDNISTGGMNDSNGNVNGNTNNTGGSQSQSGINTIDWVRLLHLWSKRQCLLPLIRTLQQV